MSNFIDLTGQKFGKWTVLEFSHSKKRANGSGRTYWKCQCECGTIKIIEAYGLRKGQSKSCGCSKGENHGLYKSKIYGVWCSLKNRCLVETATPYKNYGGRGIKVCNDWINSFLSFYKWAIQNGYKDGLTIDRIDVNGDYCPENCRWITNKEQQRNKRNNHLVYYRGETHCIAEWAEILGVSYDHIRYRVKRGQDLCKP